MKRRLFLQAGVTAGTLPHLLRADAVAPMRRIAMSTVTFRFRFRQTNPEGKGSLLLTQVPEYFASRFKLTNIEFWSKHFESREPAYLEELKQAMAKSQTALINIQVDEAYTLAAADAEKRKAGIEICKGWLDTTAALGAPSMRVNSGAGDFAACVASLKELDAYAQSKGLILLVENHGGLSGDPDTLLKLIDAVGSPNVRILADFANFPPHLDIYEALKKLYPRTHLISAKTKEFNQAGQHTSFDFDRCVRLAEESGFRGIYSAEQWAANNNPDDFEKAADWMIERLKANIR